MFKVGFIFLFDFYSCNVFINSKFTNKLFIPATSFILISIDHCTFCMSPYIISIQIGMFNNYSCGIDIFICYDIQIKVDYFECKHI